MDKNKFKICIISFQTIHDSGTFDELCQRQSITAESIFGDEYDADLVTGSGSDVDSPSDGQNSNPECERPPKGTARPQLSKRQQSVIQYMRDQASIDDDPVAILSVSFCLNSQYFWKWTNANPMKIFGRAATASKLYIRLKLSLG